MLPGIATTVLYASLTSWTEFLGALTFLTPEDRDTLPVARVNVQQRFYVQGLASGAVKG